MNTTTLPAAAAADAVPKAPFDAKPLLLLGAIALLALPLVGNPASWATLTLAGLAMGLIIAASMGSAWSAGQGRTA